MFPCEIMSPMLLSCRGLVRFSFAVVMLLQSHAGLATLMQESAAAPLDIKIESMQIADGTFEDILTVLRQNDPTNILLGLEKLPRTAREEEPTFTFNLGSATARQVLDHGKCPELRWRLSGGSQTRFV